MPAIGSGYKETATSRSNHVIQLTAQDRAQGFRCHRTLNPGLAEETKNLGPGYARRDLPFEYAGFSNFEVAREYGDSAAHDDQVSNLRRKSGLRSYAEAKYNDGLVDKK